jgi:hypothetical protein
MLTNEEIWKMTGKELEAAGYRPRPEIEHKQEEEEKKQKDKADHD